MPKNKSHSQKELHATGSYAQMEPAMKKKVLFNKAIRYKSLDPTGKGKPRRKRKAFLQISRLV